MFYNMPAGGRLPTGRSERHFAQLSSLLLAVHTTASRGLRPAWALLLPRNRQRAYAEQYNLRPAEAVCKMWIAKVIIDSQSNQHLTFIEKVT